MSKTSQQITTRTPQKTKKKMSTKEKNNSWTLPAIACYPNKRSRPEAEMTRNQRSDDRFKQLSDLARTNTSIWLLHTLTSRGLPCLTKTPSTPDSIFPPHRDISSSQRCSRGRANNVSTWACLPPAIHNAPASSSTACLVLIDNYPVSGHEVQTIRRTGKAMRLKPDNSQAQNPVIVLVRDDCADTLPPTSLDS